MPLKPKTSYADPDYPERRSKIARQLARAAMITGTTVVLGCGCGGSQQQTEDPVTLPGEPPITQLEDEADEQENEPLEEGEEQPPEE